MGRVAAALVGCALAIVLAGGGCGFSDAGLSGGGDDAAADDVTVDARSDAAEDRAAGDAPHDSTGMDAPRDSTGQDAPSDTSGGDGPPSDAGDAGDGCMSNVENCTNGVDDDCNGLIDCQDPMCGATYCSCVDPLPNGSWTVDEQWEGNGNPPACSTGFGSPTAAFAGAITDPGCAACTCGGPTATCQVHLAINDNSNCMGSACNTVALGNGKCAPVNANCSSDPDGPHQQIDNPAPQGASCPPGGGALQSYSWASGAESCRMNYAPMQGACQAGKISVPTPGNAFMGGVCIATPADVACSGSYSHKHLVYSGASDGRACSACTCANPTGVNCSAGIVTVYSDGACNTPTQQDNTGDSCDGRVHIASAELTGSTASGGNCKPGGGMESGSVTPTGPTTFCCAM